MPASKACNYVALGELCHGNTGSPHLLHLCRKRLHSLQQKQCNCGLIASLQMIFAVKSEDGQRTDVALGGWWLMRAARHFSANWMRWEFSGLWLSEGAPTRALYLMNLFAGCPDSVHHLYHKYDR